MTASLRVLAFATAFPFAAVAQQGVLNANEFLPAGSQYSMRAATNFNVLDTTFGANVTWEMAGLTLTGPAYQTSFLVPASTPYASNFPAANLAVYEASLPRYSYFDRSATAFSRLGFYYNGQIGTYSDTQIELRFPLQLGSTSDDTWDCDAFTFPGTYRYTCIGSGTLEIPSGTYEDVLLLRGVSNNLTDFKFYQWVSAETGAYLMFYFVPNPPFQSEGAQVLTSLVVGVDENNGLLPMRLHAVVDGTLPVSYTSAEPLRYRLLDAAGRTAATGNLAAATNSTGLVDVAMLRSGIYLIELASSTTSRTERFFVP